MAQILHLGPDLYVTVDRIWRDGGADIKWAFIGGQKVMIEAGRPPLPTVLQKGNEFFYLEGTKIVPVDNPDHVAWLPEPFRKTALAFVDKVREGSKIPKLKEFTDKEEAKIALVTKRGRPTKREVVPEAIEVKSEKDLEKIGI